MKTAEEIKKWMDKRNIQDKEIVLSAGTAESNPTLSWCNVMKISELLLTFSQSVHAQFQPTEKTAEWTCKKCGHKLPKGVDFDMHVCQSDSVEAEEFKKFVCDMYGIGEDDFETGLTPKHWIEAANKFSSKVKPVNEKMREATTSNGHNPDLKLLYNGFTWDELKELIVGSLRVAADMRYNDRDTAGLIASDLRLKIESALSTAPDDGWIPVEKELPKEGVRVWAYFPEGEIEGCSTGIRRRGKNEVCSDFPNSTAFMNIATHWQPLPKSPR